MRTTTSLIPRGIILAMSALFILLSNTVASSAQTLGDLTISKAWIRTAPAGARVFSGFLKIANNGADDDTLMGAEYTGAKKTMIHQMKIEDGVMKMRAAKNGLKIAAGSSLALKPGGTHMMFMGLSKKPEEGQKVPIKLTFANAGEITIEFLVLSMENAKQHMMQEN